MDANDDSARMSPELEAQLRLVHLLAQWRSAAPPCGAPPGTSLSSATLVLSSLVGPWVRLVRPPQYRATPRTVTSLIGV